MVKKFLDQKVRARNFEARNDRPATGTPATSRSKGKSVSVTRKQGDCCPWKAKGKGTEEDACSLRHDESKSGKLTRSSCATPKSQTHNDGKSSSTGRPEAAVHLDKKFEDRAMITLVGFARTPRVIIGVLPCVRVTNLTRAAISVKSARFCTKRLIVISAKDGRKMVERVLLSC